MAYEYLNTNKVKKCVQKSRLLINKVQNYLRSKISIDPRLIGSKKYSLITVNGKKGYFDIDFTLVITKSDNWDANYLKKTIFDTFQRFYCYFGFNKIEQGSRSIKLKFSENGEMKYYIELAIYTYDNQNNPFILKFDKRSQKMIWNPEDIDIDELDAKLKQIKKSGLWNEFREIYLDKKNYYLHNNINMKSLSIYKETVNEIYQKYS